MKPYTATIEVAFYAETDREAVRKADHITARAKQHADCLTVARVVQVRNRNKVIHGIDPLKK